MSATLAGLDGARIDGGWYTTVTDFARDTHWLNEPLRAWSDYGAFFFGLLLVLGWFGARRADARTMAGALSAILGVALAYAADALIKEIVREPRPCRALPHDFQVEACPAPSDYAFPSNHATFAFAAAAALLLVNRRLGWIAAVAAVLMAFARVYVGAHYPHDVIAGALLGILVAVATVRTGRRLGAPVVERLRAGPLRPLVGSGPRS
ncbi:membrane-associated phospholipid phosphatase [Kitasatospora sp. MAP12-15]|uniref:phosphatase PAP2 family protein n=1 Tax=unclassified Kitasatospora TaxID=2633591 RepID=UPI00247620E6|nr:phosphatase PAP2 family protein [Kitasatospora sp. MAP12-44]MDH6108512.1 membrane-associated phospholipid phosphatase [Kitasatospora sp. MAP12-44]